MKTIALSLIQHTDVARSNLHHLQKQIDQYQECHSLRAAHEALDASLIPYWPGDLRSEQETHRGGDETYLYFYWGLHNAPRPRNGKPQKKTYIGNRPHRIALARAMVQNRADLQDLKRLAARTDAALNSTHRQLVSALRSVQTTQRQLSQALAGAE